MTERSIRSLIPGETWEPLELRPLHADRERYASFGFVRLAMLPNLSPELSRAYETRLLPDAPDHFEALEEQLHQLTPADLARFMALQQANTVQWIFSKAWSDEGKPPRLTVLQRFGPQHTIPVAERCDAYGQPLHVLREPSSAFRRAEAYGEQVEKAVRDALAPSDRAEEMETFTAYRCAWIEAGQSLAATQSVEQAYFRSKGPDIEQLTVHVSYEQ